MNYESLALSNVHFIYCLAKSMPLMKIQNAPADHLAKKKICLHHESENFHEYFRFAHKEDYIGYCLFEL